jgi:hypothetical protein
MYGEGNLGGSRSLILLRRFAPEKKGVRGHPLMQLFS